MDFLLSLQETYDKGIALVGLPETNLNWNKFSTRDSMRISLRRLWEQSTFATSICAEPFQSDFQPGGTSTLVLDRWTNRVFDKGSDPSGLGRWSWITLRGKGLVKISFVTCYRVCNQRYGAGERTAYRQQYRMLQRSGQFRATTRLDPHRQTILDLQHFLLSLKSKGHDIVLMIDSNESTTQDHITLETPDTPASTAPPDTTPANHEANTYQHVLSTQQTVTLDSLVQTCGLTDALRYHHQQGTPPATYNRGTKRIDYIFISRRLRQCSLRAGLLPFNTFFFGDHRPMFIDFDAHSLFQDTTNLIVSPKSRALRLKDPRDVSKYQSSLHDYIQHHRIPDRVQSLASKQATQTWTPHLARDYETLDYEITTGMLHAERACAKRHTGKYFWSRSLAQAGETIRYWKLRRKAALGLPYSKLQLDQRRLQANLSVDLTSKTLTLNDIIIHLRQAWKTLRQCQLRHTELRQNYLEEIATAIVTKRAPWIDPQQLTSAQADRIAQALRNLQAGEKRRHVYNSIRTALAPTLKKAPFTGSLTRLDVPDTERDILETRFHGDPNHPASWTGPWRSITDPEDIFRFITKQNITQFYQASSTPFGSGPLADALGLAANTPTADAILAGEDIYQLHQHLPDEVSAFIAELKAPPTIRPKEVSISPEQFQEAYKRVNEKTSSSPSGRHVGHYKASLDSPTLCQLHATMMSIPFQTGHSPARWQMVIDIMLEKDPGVPKLHRLRIIQLMESDKNQALRILFALQILHYAEDTDLVNDMQYGSRPGKMCVTPVLNKTLSYDLLRQTKTTGATLDIDALGCFDRMIPSLVLLLARRLGMPPTATTMLGRTWKSTSHGIRTGYGVSSTTYGSTGNTPLFGAGQGSCAACLFWLLTSTIIYEALDTIAFGFLFESVCADFTHHRKGDSFVDDAAFGTVSRRPPSSDFDHDTNTTARILESKEGLTTIGQTYERLLWTSGGALNLTKCLWYLISWRWINGRARLSTTAESPATLELTSGDNPSPTEIPRLEPTIAHRTLGIHIAPSGSMAACLSRIRSQSSQFAQCLKESPSLTHDDAYLAYTVFHLPKVRYPLPVTTLTHTQCTHAQAPALLELLPRLHLNRNTARSIVHGTARYAGLQLPHLYLEQGIGQLKLFLGHLRANDKTSELIQISLSYLQQEVGLPTTALNLPYSSFKGWVEPTWLTSLWDFLNFASLTISLPDNWSPTLARDNDIFLTDHFLRLPLTTSERGRLNRCRLYYQAFTLADLVTGDGLSIDKRAKQGIHIPDRVSLLNWPTQERPPKKDWKLWAAALSHLESADRLTTPLGAWTTDTYHQPRHWAVDPITQIGYTCFNDVWTEFIPTRPTGRTRAQRQAFYTLPGDPCDFPDHATLDCAYPKYDITLPADIFQLSSSPSTPTPTPPPVPLLRGPSILHRSLQQEPLMLQKLIGPLTCSNNNVLSLATLIRHNMLHSCSDGSVHLGIGCHAWIFSDPKGAIILQGAGPDDGGVSLMSSYRSELGGLTALLCILKHVLIHHPTATGRCTIYCDNTSALNNVFAPFLDAGIYPLIEADYDLLGVARSLLHALSITIDHEWVKGHYTGKDRQLKHDLNDQVDEMASSYRLSPHPTFLPTQYPTLHPDMTTAVYSSGIMVTSRLSKTVYDNVYNGPLLATIGKNSGTSPPLLNRIDWDSHERTFRALSRQHKISVSKYVHNLWHTASKAHQHTPTASPSCKLCDYREETSSHVLTCPSPEASAHRTQAYDTFLESIEHFDTPAAILAAWHHGLAHFTAATQTGVAPRPRAPSAGSIRPLDCLVTQAYLDQSALGWHNFLRGRLSKLWIKAYTHAYSFGQVSGHPAIWVKHLIHGLWTYSLSIWRFRNGHIYGHTSEDTLQRTRQDLCDQVELHYARYSCDNTYVLCRDRHLFTRLPFTRRKRHDLDSLRCWLDSVHLARQAQSLFQQQLRTTARGAFAAFFQRPTRQPPPLPPPATPPR